MHLAHSSPQKRIIVAISGASGAVHGVRLLQALRWGGLTVAGQSKPKDQ